MINANEIKKILKKLDIKKSKLSLLHCISEYPTKLSDSQLGVIKELKKFGYIVGFSDHTIGFEASIGAICFGAQIIEKHITLDNNMKGPDHKASLDPHQFKEMVSAIRNIEKALGSDIKKPSKSELPNIEIVRKSIVAKTKIKKGDVLSENNITVKRPGNGISPMQIKKLLNKVSKNNYKPDQLIKY